MPNMCHQCRREFRRAGYNAHFFCSPECRQAFYNAVRGEHRAESRAGLVCQHCGGPVAAQRSSRRFCSGRCRVAAFRAKASVS
jgi:endogenous inhibitor of DNA gyrase (YacG/DUF329 family)